MATGQLLVSWVPDVDMCANANLPVASSTTDMTALSARFEKFGARRRIVFPKAGTTAITVQGVLPPLHSTTHGYNGSGITVFFNLLGDAAGASGNVRMQAAVERLQSGTTDTSSTNYAAAQAATCAINATIGVVTTFSIAFTSGAQMDSLAAGEAFRITLQRLGADALDTYNGEVSLEFIYLRET